jgi:phosphonate transport system permease protein
MAAHLESVHQGYFRAVQIGRLFKFAGLIVFLSFAVWTIYHLNIPIERVFGMFGRVGHMVFDRMLPPNMDYALQPSILYRVFETIEMTFLGAFIGTVISIFVAWFGAWNVTPHKRILYPLGRGILVLARSVPVLIWGMLLVAILGFGPMAGVIALTLLTISFAGKLMSEQIEAIDMGPVEAMRATGASPIKVFLFAVIPQVEPAWTGIAIYNWDSIFRASTILGFVGAGGLGIYLRMNIQELEYENAMGVISLIIVLVIISEVTSHFLRGRFYED